MTDENKTKPIDLERRLENVINYSKKIDRAIEDRKYLAAVGLLEAAPEGVCKDLGYAMVALAYIKEAEQGLERAPTGDMPIQSLGGFNSNSKTMQYQFVQHERESSSPFTNFVFGSGDDKPKYGSRTMDAYECIVKTLAQKSGDYLAGMLVPQEKKECGPSVKYKPGMDPR